MMSSSYLMDNLLSRYNTGTTIFGLSCSPGNLMDGSLCFIPNNILNFYFYYCLYLACGMMKNDLTINNYILFISCHCRENTQLMSDDKDSDEDCSTDQRKSRCYRPCFSVVILL